MTTINTLYNCIRAMSLEQLLISVFCLCFFIEWLSGKSRKLHIYSLSDSLNNLVVGSISLAFDFLFSMGTFPLWLWISDHAGIFELDNSSTGTFLLLFLLVDLSEYWFHRFSHTINLLWSAHIVHHQSEFFNLSVGLRTSFFVPLFNIFVYLLFPLLGFDPAQVLLIIFIQGMFQLLVHTELVGKLGWLEYIFVTPSAHRVHHGKNEIYLDKNYGKFFIIWDRLFGTYQEETETAKFGITKPLEKNSPVYSILEPFRKLIRSYRSSRSKEARKMMLWCKPELVDEYFH